MPETAAPTTGAKTPTAQPQGEGQPAPEPWGGEVHVRGGAAPSALRWVNYGLFVWAVVYLMVHPRLAEGQIFLWIAAGLLTVWAIIRFVTKKPPEI